MPAAPDFHVHSTFSTLDGMGTPMDVVKRAKALGWGAVCLTEHGWMGSAPLFYKAARSEGLNPIIGCEFYIVEDDDLGVKQAASYHLTVLAISAEGYHNLVAWCTFASQRENFHYKPRISLLKMVEIAPYDLNHNVVLSGCLGSELCIGLSEGIDAVPYVQAMKSLFPNFYIEVQNHGHSKFMDKGYHGYEEMVAREKVVRHKLVALAEGTGTKTVLTNDSHFQTTDQRTSHLMLISNKMGGNKGWAANYLPQYGYFTSYMQSMEKIAERTDDLPDDILQNGIDIGCEASIVLDPLDKFTYSIPFSGYQDPLAKIRKRSARRLAALTRIHGVAAEERFEIELDAMGDFAHYLLIMSDLIIYARKQGILINTRGSVANSMLCYCLKIHDIDPMPDAYNLIFSRFVNPSRKKLPDIDIDIQKDRFDDFMAYVQEYMAEREGEGQVVQICNYGTFANRATFRMIGEKLGMEKEAIDEMAKLLPQMIDSGMVDEEEDVYELLKEQYPEIYEMASGVFDSIRNVSQHACGWLFGTKDRPIEKWIPLTLIASSGRMVTQYNMKILEDLGLNKGDFLRLKTLDVIQNTRKMIGQDGLDITDIPLDDPETFQMLRDGRTEGIFTLQGKENRRGCMEVEVESVHDVIRTVAIYRPALTREGRHTRYNERRRGVEEWESHPVVEPIMRETFGVPVFQEQAMEIGYAVGMSDEEVDEIYKAIKLAMGVGRHAKEAFAKIKPKFLARCKSMGIPKAERAALWELLVAFQGYGFNKGHATSYGILAVRAAYLKAHYPAEFFTALLDVYPEKAKYVAAARDEGFKFLPPDVSFSGRGFTLDRESGSIRVGLARVKGLGPAATGEIFAGQPFHSYEDFKNRTSRRAVNKTRLETLATIGAFESLGIKGGANDAQQFQILGFTLKKPKALRNIKPRHVGERVSSSGWNHLGLDKTAEITEGRASVSKLFWIPDIEDSKHFKLLDLKASPWAQVKTYLLTAIDVNGLPFHIMCNEDKESESRILKVLADKFRGHVICCDGGIRQPFLQDGPMGFRFYGITGADYKKDPQIWKPDGTPLGTKKKLGFVGLHEMKQQERRRKAA